MMPIIPKMTASPIEMTTRTLALYSTETTKLSNSSMSLPGSRSVRHFALRRELLVGVRFLDEVAHLLLVARRYGLLGVSHLKAALAVRVSDADILDRVMC